MLGVVINGRYQILSELGSGGYGQVYRVRDLCHNNLKAIKFSKNHSSLFSEYNILKDLQGEGIPKIYKYGQYNNSSFLIMQLLGSNLYSLLRSEKIAPDSIPSLLSKCLERIEYIHNKNYIHRDIKPHQFVTGHKNRIYLLDFGISNKYIIDKCHISFQSNCRFVGSCHFASMNAHIGIRLSRRDDLESFVYSAIFLITKSLPWMGINEVTNFNKWNLVFRLKREMLQLISIHNPVELTEILKYVTSLKFEETPDYKFIKDLLRKFGKNQPHCEIVTQISQTHKKRISLREKSFTSNKHKNKLKKKSKTIHQNHGQSKLQNSEKLALTKKLLFHSNISTNHNTSLEETEKGSFPEFSPNLQNLLHSSSKAWIIP